MKISRRPKVSRQIRVIRISKPSVVHPIKRVDSRISSVDSWLSSEPSIKEPKLQEPPKKVIKQPPTTKTTQRNHVFCRGWIVLVAVILTILFICIIVGIVLAVELQTTTTMITMDARTTISN